MAKIARTKYIVRQPIKDLKGNTLGYEIRYTGENYGYNEETGQDFMAAETIYNFLTQAGDKTLKGGLNFMTFTTNLLMKNTPKLFAPEDLVIEVSESVIIHPLAMRFLERYHQEGYSIAIKDFQFAPRYISNLRHFDYVMVDLHHAEDDSVKRLTEMIHSMGKKCIVTGVDDEVPVPEGLHPGGGRHVRALRRRADVHCRPLRQLSAEQFFRLLVAVTKDEPEVDEIEQIISMDASLTYSLLRIVNSAYFALRNRATNVHQAVTILGLGQLRQWIYLMGCSNEKGELDESQEEMLKLSFTRASFASELMRFAKNMPINRNDAYLMGMFSTLPFLIAAPLEDILAEVPVADEIKNALLNHEGRCGMLYDLLLSYEAADWDRITKLAEELGIPDNMMTSVYFICMENVNTLWEQLTNPYPRQGEEAEEPPAPEPVHEFIEPENPGYINVMQVLVEEKAPKYIQMFGLCPCKHCQADVMALTLSNLVPKYVVLPKRDRIPMLTVYEGRYNSTISPSSPGPARWSWTTPPQPGVIEQKPGQSAGLLLSFRKNQVAGIPSLVSIRERHRVSTSFRQLK